MYRKELGYVLRFLADELANKSGVQWDHRRFPHDEAISDPLRADLLHRLATERESGVLHRGHPCDYWYHSDIVPGWDGIVPGWGNPGWPIHPVRPIRNDDCKYLYCYGAY
jgi:hypothetical protein